MRTVEASITKTQKNRKKEFMGLKTSEITSLLTGAEQLFPKKDESQGKCTVKTWPCD
ncbi:MAG TPA: hypothetical protein VLF93_07810 [Candidatus Saccharimonadales bacterium]|nr:hypothetical protein [Candidatus Saccharimonadales bacterium]